MDDLISDLRKKLKVQGKKKQEENSPSSHPGGKDRHSNAKTTGFQKQVFTCPVDHSGTSVYLKGWVDTGSEYFPVLIVHDLGENVGIYKEFAKILVESGISIYGFDLRGHGRSGHMLGHIPDFNSLVNDLLQVVAWIRYKSKGRLPIILGQGIGSLIAVYFQRKYPKMCSKLILTSPCVHPPRSLSRLHRFMIWLLAEISPTMRIPRSLTPRFLMPSSGARRLASGQRVKESFYGITSNFTQELLTALWNVGDKFKEIDCPVLVICPLDNEEFDYKILRELITIHKNSSNFAWQNIEARTHYFLTDNAATQAESILGIQQWVKGEKYN